MFLLLLHLFLLPLNQHSIDHRVRRMWSFWKREISLFGTFLFFFWFFRKMLFPLLANSFVVFIWGEKEEGEGVLLLTIVKYISWTSHSINLKRWERAAYEWLGLKDVSKVRSDPSEAAASEECYVCLIKLSHIKNERDDDLWRNLICGTVIDSKTYKMGCELFQSSLFVFYFFFFA